MTGPSTDSSHSPFLEELRRLAASAERYYLLGSGIEERIVHGGRTFYSRFRRIDTPPNPIVLSQHLRRELTVGLPLLDREERGRLIVLEYLGEDPRRFHDTLRRLVEYLGAGRLRCYLGRRPHQRICLLETERRSLEELARTAERISDALQLRLTPSWKILPRRDLPPDANIYTLPYGYIN